MKYGIHVNLHSPPFLLTFQNSDIFDPLEGQRLIHICIFNYALFFVLKKNRHVYVYKNIYFFE